MTTPSKSFEDRIFDAVVSQFFAPQMVNSTVFNHQTGQNEPTVISMQSEASRVAQAIFDAKRQEITDEVKTRIDMEQLADAIWEKVRDSLVAVLTSTPGPYSYSYDPHKTEREAMQKRVNEIVAQEIARRTLEKLDQDAQAEATA